ncbi:MAG: HAD-IB family hydrolase [Actinomycetota bacterium]|nr:MAG: HAD-IB family hydrolase [Actinomycetota bacterium]
MSDGCAYHRSVTDEVPGSVPSPDHAELFAGHLSPVDLSTGGRAAAFFDLDKTILARSSAFAFARPFYQGGLIGRSDLLRSAYAQFVYLVSGADHDQMEQMRAYMSALCSGWEVERVRQIVAETLDTVVDPLVYAEAVELIDEHRAAGRDTIVISSSGTELVEPIGARLGVDLAIGTQLAIDDGRYTGEILFYAYGEGKAEAMRALAAERGYDLAACYAYSDSQTDLPMLELVGHPVATNPDAELRRVAAERDWPIRDFARPVALRSTRAARARRRTAVGAAVGAAAVGVAWYAARRVTRTHG